MNMHAFLELIKQSGFATTIRESIWMFPIIESIHVISFTTVVGAITVVDLRLLGLASTQRSFQRMEKEALKWVWPAFAVTVLTGLTMFTTNATQYYVNPFFRTKMILLVLAGLNVAAFEFTAKRSVQQWDRARSAPPAGKAVAVLSITLWVAIIFMGRIVGFTTQPGAVQPPPPGVNFNNFLGPAAGSGSSGGGGSTTTPAPSSK